MDDFDVFVRAHGPSLAGVAYLLCGHTQTAEDLVQNALAKAHKSWDRVSSADHPEAYVRKILVREYLGWRRLKNTSEVPTDTPHLLHGHASDGNTAIDRVGETDAMWQLLAHLPRQQRAALVMRYYLDLPDDEIAPHLGCSAATVRSHLSRGLKTLRSITPATPDKGSHR